MIRALVVASIFTLSLYGCDKTGKNYDGTCPQGTIRLYNDSNDPYTVYINGNYLTVMQGQTKYDYDIDKGAHTVKVVQLTGFNGQPTERTGGTIIEGCDVDEFIFP